MESGIRCEIDPQDYAKIVRASKEYDRALGLALTRRIKAAAKPLVAQVKSKAGELSFGGSGEKHTGLRAALANAITLSSSAPKRGSGGVTIRIRAAKMPANQRTLPRAVVKKNGWRHPVFASESGGKSEGVWVPQSASDPDWFRGTLQEGGLAVRPEIEAALNDAAQEVGLYDHPHH